jgi:tetratricopeptide (TPR) repeat protein
MTFKKLIFCAYLFFTFATSDGQNVCSFSPEYVNTVFCLSGYSNYNDNINASAVVEDILANINLKNTYFVTKVCKGINNAVAIKYNGVKYILLDVDWMESLKYGENDWFHLFVISHEMGHHLLKHTERETTSIQESRMNELSADEFGGYMLGIYGASLSDINSLLINFPDENNKNSTHPPKSEREIAVKKGYNSSKKNETSLLIQSLTKDVDFDLTSLPYLISVARNKFNSYLETNDKNILSQAIESYQEAVRFSNDPLIAYELGALFLAKGEREKYNTALELAYQKTKDEKFILELFGSVIESEDKNIDKILLKYFTISKSLSTEKYYEPICLQGIIKYFMYMARKNYDKEGINFDYLDKAETFCKEILSNYSSRSEDKEILNNKAEINNALGLCELWRENYDLSIKYFSKARTDFESAKKYDTQLENVFCYYSLNLLMVNYNIALSSVRIRDWQNGFDAITNYENLFDRLNKDKQEYLKTLKNDIDYQAFYIKGRCYHGLEEFPNAVESFTIAMKYESNAHYLYFYRGLSYLGLDKNTEACNDFEIACKNGVSDACNRLNSSCK